MTDTVLPDEIIAAAMELKEVRAQEAVLKRRDEDLRDQIIKALEGTTTGLTASGAKAVHTITQHRRGVNTAKLEALFPEVFNQVMEEKESVVLKIDL